MPHAAAPQLAKGVLRETVNAFGLAVVRGDFPADQLLPKEDALAAHFDVGRSTLREAVKVLSGKGLVRTVRRYGSRVCARADWNLLDPDVLAWHLIDPGDVLAFLEEITEFRAMVEPEAAALAARRATPKEAARLVTLGELLLTTPPDAAVEIDVSFHLGVLNAAHNRLLGAFGRSLGVLLRAQFHLSQRYLTGPARYRPDEKHLLLARAITQRDADAARAASESMLQVIRKFVRAAKRSDGQGTAATPGSQRQGRKRA